MSERRSEREAEAGWKAPEQGKPEPAESKEEREAEPIRREFEYRDKDGRLLGKAIVELDAQEVEMELSEERSVAARSLRSLVLEGEKDGKPVKFDVLELANKNGVQIYVSAEKKADDYMYENELNLAVVPIPDNPIEMATLLHELGHGEQYHDERFEEVGKLYDYKNDAEKGPYYYRLKPMLDEVMKAVPEVNQVIDHDLVRQLDRLDERRLADIQEGTRLVELLKEGGSDGKENPLDILKRVNDLDEQVQATYRAQQLLMEEIGLAELVSLPTKMLERDATRRAFEWMRTIRQKAGVDLFAPVVAPEAPSRSTTKENSSGCASYAAGARQEGDRSLTMTAKEDLQQALATYQADRLRFKRPGEEGPGITPVAGGTRKKV